jgi:hypothetical protein
MPSEHPNATPQPEQFDLGDALPAEPIAMKSPPAETASGPGQSPGVKGAAAPPDRTQSEGTEQGIRAPGFESIQSANDVAGAMHNYQAQLVSTLTTITQVLLDTTSRLEQLENYLDRLR